MDVIRIVIGITIGTHIVIAASALSVFPQNNRGGGVARAGDGEW